MWDISSEMVHSSGTILLLFINTPLQWGVQKARDLANRFSGLQTVPKTAKAVGSPVWAQITPLKWGVTEKGESHGPQSNNQESSL
jgi:hypothetical protein